MPGDIIGSISDALDQLQQSESESTSKTSNTEAIDNVGKNVVNSSLYGVEKKKPPKIKPALTSPEKTRLKNKMDIIVESWFKLKKKYEKDDKGKTVVAKAKKDGAAGLPTEEDGEKAGGGLMSWLTGLMGILGMGKGPLMKILGKWLWKGIKWGAGKIWGALKGVGKAAWGAIKSGFKGVGSFFKGLWSGFKGSAAWKSFTGALSKGVSAAKGALSSAGKFLSGALKSVGNAAKAALQSIKPPKPPKPPGKPKAPKPKKWWQKVGSAISKGWEKTKSVAKTVGGKALDLGKTVVKKGKAVVGKAVDIGKTVVKKVGKGFQVAKQWAGKGASWLKSKIVAPIKSKIGKYVGGMVKGSGGIFGVLKKFARIPVIGPIIEGFFMKKELQAIKDKFNAGEIDEKEMNKLAGQQVTKSVGAMAGAAIGGIVGSFIPIPIVGTLIGAIGGDLVGRFVGDMIGKHVLKDTWKEKIGQFALKALTSGVPTPKDPVNTSVMDPSYVPPDMQKDMQDFIMQRGKLTPFSSKDEILGMKKGGAISQLLGESKDKSEREPSWFSKAVKSKREPSWVSKVLKSSGAFASKLMGRSRDNINMLLGRSQENIGKLLGRSKDITNKLLGNSTGIASKLLKSSKDSISKLFGWKSKDGWKPAGQEKNTTGIRTARIYRSEPAGGSDRLANLQIAAIDLSNKYLYQIVQLTQALVTKSGGGSGGGSLVSITKPSNSAPPTQGSPEGPSFTDSRVEFYNSPYSMHTPGTLT